MGGLKDKLPITYRTFVIGSLALAGFALTSGFFSKEAILHAAHLSGHTVPWMIGLIVALLTPFYMTRLFIVAFLGKSRDEGADHAKEVPPIMFVPLAILALFALFSAYKFPAVALKATVTDYAFAHGFHPDITMILSVVALIAGVGLAIWTYRGRETDPINIPLFKNKFYVDELYAGLIAIFQDAVATILDVADRYIIDPLTVRLPSMTAFASGSFLRLFQVGNIQGYVFLFGAGVVALLWFLLF